MSVLAGAIQTAAELDEVIANLEAAIAAARRGKKNGERANEERQNYVSLRRIHVPGSGLGNLGTTGPPDYGMPGSGPNSGGGG